MKRKRLRALLATGAVTALASLGLAGGPAQAAAASTGTTASSSSCTSVRQTASGRIDSAGRATTDKSAATRNVFSSNGTTITAVTPPEGFNPLTATDAQLRAYGYPPRPTGRQALAQWRQQHAHVKPFTDWSSGHGFCLDDRRNPPPTATSYSSTNWSGLVATKGSGYTEADGEWEEPSFTSTCASDSSYSIWPGIGGFSGSSWGLIQAGTDTGSSSANDMYTWFELISSAHSFPEIETNAPISPGDTIVVYVWWDSTNSAADFEFDNITQGWDGAIGVTAVNGVPASDFYSPTSAEVISERATGSSGLLQLRKPSSGEASFYGMDINDGPAYNDSTLSQITMVNSSGDTMSTVDDFYTVPTDGYTYWDTTWHRCS